MEIDLNIWHNFILGQFDQRSTIFKWKNIFQFGAWIWWKLELKSDWIWLKIKITPWLTRDHTNLMAGCYNNYLSTGWEHFRKLLLNHLQAIWKKFGWHDKRIVIQRHCVQGVHMLINVRDINGPPHTVLPISPWRSPPPPSSASLGWSCSFAVNRKSRSIFSSCQHK
jgi:hypothetical protein